MLDFLSDDPKKIVVVGDVFVSPDTMEEAVRKSRIKSGEIVKVFWGNDDKQLFAARQLNIERNGPEAESYADGLDALIADADILFTHFSPVPRKLIEKGKKLKAILTCRGGVEHICMEAANERNIPVINVIRNAEAVAEFTIGLIIAMTRNIAISHHALTEGKWMKTFPNSDFTTTLSQLTLGLAGVGSIGIEVALRLKALGINMIAHDKYVSPDTLGKNGLECIRMVPTLEDLFREADVISLHLRLTKENKGLIDKRYFSLMKPTAYFVNTARGGLVNQEDLVEVLKNHAIAGAALDVFDVEPIDGNSELMGLDNLVFTPHIAGTTVDAIPKCPFMLLREVDKILTKGVTDRIVNYRNIAI